MLLLGDADANGIPTWRFPQTDPQLQSGRDTDYVSDHPYKLIDDDDDSPDIALGRVPAQTVEEARAVLAKIKQYEASPRISAALPPGGFPARAASAGRNRITYAAGEGHYGAMDNLFESLFKKMVDTLVPDSFDISMTYAKASSIYCPPPSKLTDSILQRLSEGSLLFNYVGHGYPLGFDSLYWGQKRYPILKTTDLKRAPNAIEGTDQPQMPIAFLSCCSTGYYDLPKGEHCLAEELLFDSFQGAPIAVIAGSRITHPYANTVLQMDITKALLVDRAPTVGMLDLLASQALLKPSAIDRELDAIATPIAALGKWKTSLADLRQMHVKLYNLLGDPATRIALPAQSITELKIENGHITGRVEGMKSGRIYVTAETERTGVANPTKLETVNGDNDPDLEAKAANNYPLANDRVLMRIEGEVADGKFDLALPEALPAAVAVLRAYAAGVNEGGGESTDAIGALRIAIADSATAVH